MSLSQTRSFGNFASDGGGVVAWVSPSNASIEDGVESTCPFVLDGDVSDGLQAYSGGFAIPKNSVVDGIEYRVKKRAPADVVDLQVVPLPTGDDSPDPASWPAVLTDVFYGSPTSKFGRTWTPAQINAGTFGFQISCIVISGTPLTAGIDFIEATVYYTLIIPPASSNILYNRTAAEMRQTIRRLINDVDADQFGISEHELSELLIGDYFHVIHQLGADPRVPTKSTSGVSMLGYILAAGDYQCPQETRSDSLASDFVLTDLSDTPLKFVPRAQLEAKVQRDLRESGIIQRGIPAWWTLRIEQVNQNEMRGRILVYPAAEQSCVLSWPRAVADPDTVDPSSTTGRMALSYQATAAVQYRVAAEAIRKMPDRALMRNRLTRSAADSFLSQSDEAILREIEERSSHFRTDRVQEGNW